MTVHFRPQTDNAYHRESYWYAVHCQPLKEWQAAAALEEHLGLIVYLPEIRRRFRGRIQRAPLFPRYLFIQANLEEIGFSGINTTPGVLRLVTFGEMPPPIPETVIEALRQRVEHFNTSGGLMEHTFHPGDKVRLKSGSLQGLEALFVGPMRPSERVRILIEFLGSLREAEINIDLLEPVATEPPPKLERRTRGKGRTIKAKGGGRKR